MRKWHSHKFMFCVWLADIAQMSMASEKQMQPKNADSTDRVPFTN